MKIVSPGVRLEAEVRVSPGRETVRLKLTQSSTELIDIRKEKTPAIKLNDVEREHPRLRESSVTTAITVGDSVAVVLPLTTAPLGFHGKDRVPVYIVRPIVRIGEEEAAKVPHLVR